MEKTKGMLITLLEAIKSLEEKNDIIFNTQKELASNQIL